MYNIPPDRWLDLSTGVSPFSWTVPDIPQEFWHHLPQADDGLEEVATNYYGTSLLLPCAGSQAAIQAIPGFRSPSRVGLLSPSYSEHQRAWLQAGHQVEVVEARDLVPAADTLDVLVICNPNNPTGCLFEPALLSHCRSQLAKRGGWLLVDEAFIDPTPDFSISQQSGAPGLIVLRSLGKFFGLAGARVGFVLAWSELLASLKRKLGPWTISGPSRWIAKSALADGDWQLQSRILLPANSSRLSQLLSKYGLSPHGGSAFFQWVIHDNARCIHEQLASQGILIRRFEQPESLRFGLPGSDEGWQRLEQALSNLSFRLPTLATSACSPGTLHF